MTMTILIADDVAANRKLLRAFLEAEGYPIVEAETGEEALALLRGATEPMIGLIDWEMPELDGIEVCRRAPRPPDAPPIHLILLTFRDNRNDIVAGLEAGANDYVTKPFDQAALLARVKIGVCMVEAQQNLIDRARKLEEALVQVQTLQGLLPICSYCKKIRDDQNYWQQLESYISQHSAARFSHGICPECYEARVKPELARMMGDIAS